MSVPASFSSPPLPRRILIDVLLALLATQCLYLLWPFLSPICWAVILAYVTWPLYRRARIPLGRFNSTAAFLMTLLVSCAVVLPFLWLLVLLQEEFLRAYRLVTADLAQGHYSLPPLLRGLPWAGQRLQEAMDQYALDPGVLEKQIVVWVQQAASGLPSVLAMVGANLGKLALTVLTLFFLYRDGELLVQQGQRITGRFVGERLDPYARAAGAMTRAVLYGFLVTAVAQGFVAGIGYTLVGLEAPVLLGALTGVLSVLPVLGTAFVWGPVGVWLLLTDHVWRGILLLAWGALLVHPTDNVLRPLLISNAARVPFLLVMLGALGGLAAYGLVGVFIGPVLLGAGVAVWREWASDDEPETN